MDRKLCEKRVSAGGVSLKGIPVMFRRRVCKGCGRFFDEHGSRRRNGACRAFVYSHSIILTWDVAAQLYAPMETMKAADSGSKHELF